jgi:hypothetical protein
MQLHETPFFARQSTVVQAGSTWPIFNKTLTHLPGSLRYSAWVRFPENTKAKMHHREKPK